MNYFYEAIKICEKNVTPKLEEKIRNSRSWTHTWSSHKDDPVHAFVLSFVNSATPKTHEERIVKECSGEEIAKSMEKFLDETAHIKNYGKYKRRKKTHPRARRFPVATGRKNCWYTVGDTIIGSIESQCLRTWVRDAAIGVNEELVVSC